MTEHPQQPLSNMTDDELVEHMHKHVENMREEYPDQYHTILADGMVFHIADMAQRIRSRPHTPSPQPTDDAIPFSDWLSIHDSIIRNATIQQLRDFITSNMNDGNCTVKGECPGVPCWCELCIFDKASESLRTPTSKEQP